MYLPEDVIFCRFNDVWVLDMVNMTWSCPNIRGKKPSGRFGHSQVFKCLKEMFTKHNSNTVNDLINAGGI